MSSREFSEKSERYGSTFRRVARIHCRKCGVSESLGIATKGGLLPPNVITQKFEQKGWSVGQNEQWDYCPGCANSLKEKKTPMLKVVQQKFEGASEVAPREMSREDRRIIFAKLNEVYLDSKRGYETGWSDQKVATDLGVPRKWVETIRAENFGDVGTNEEMSEFYDQAKVLIADARKALTEARKFYEEANTLMQRANPEKALAQISGRLSQIEKLGEAVRKYIVVA